MNPPLLWWLAFKHLVPLYGLFLIPALITERKNIFAPFLNIWRERKKGESLEIDRAAGKGKDPMRSAMIKPYANVIRMHLLIFFFAGAKFFNLDSFMVYAVVYFVYFFPWNEFRKKKEAVTLV